MAESKNYPVTEVKSVATSQLPVATSRQSLIDSLAALSPDVREVVRQMVDNKPWFTNFHPNAYKVMNEAEFVVAIQALEVNHTVTSMFPPKLNSDKVVLALAKALQINHTLQYIDLEIAYGKVSEVAKAALSRALGINQGLASLSFSTRSESEVDNLILEVLKTNHRLRSLSIHKINAAGTVSLVKALEVNCQLTSLILHSNKIGDAGALALAKLLETNRTLIHVDLHSFNDIGAPGAVAIAKALLSNPTLLRLDLHSNAAVGDEGAKAFAEVLGSPDSRLTHLDLSECGIGSVGMQAIAKKLGGNRTLHDLGLRYNLDKEFDQATAKAFADALTINNTLTQLDLRSSFIGDAAVVTLAKGLKRNRALYQLALSKTQIKSLGAQALQALAEALEHNYTLASIFSIEEVQDAEQGKVIIKRLERNRGLTKKLFTAIEQHDLATLQSLIDQGVYVRSNIYYEGRYTPLMKAVIENYPAAVKLLLQYAPFSSSARAGVVSNEKDRGKTALELAQARGYTEIVTLLTQPTVASSENPSNVHEQKSSLETKQQSPAISTALSSSSEMLSSTVVATPDSKPKEEKSSSPPSLETKAQSLPPALTAAPLNSTPSLELVIGSEELVHWQPAFPRMEQELIALRQQVTLPPEQFNVLIESIAQIQPKVIALEQHQAVLDQELDRDLVSQAERAKINRNIHLRAYYRTVRKLHYHFLSAKMILSGKVSQADDGVDIVIKGAVQLGKQIPGVGLLAVLFEQGSSFVRGIQKHRAMRCLAEWVPDTSAGDKLAERFARQLTLSKAADIQNSLQNAANQHPARGLVEKLCAAGKAVYQEMSQLESKARQGYRELKEGKAYSIEEKLALADTLLILEAIMSGKIGAVQGVSDSEQLEQHLEKMLNVFNFSRLVNASPPTSLSPLTRPLAVSSSVVPQGSLADQQTAVEKIDALQINFQQLMEAAAREREEAVQRETKREAEIAQLKAELAEHKAKATRIEQEHKAMQERLNPDDEENSFGDSQAQVQISRSSTSSRGLMGNAIHTRQVVRLGRRVIRLERYVGALLEENQIDMALEPSEEPSDSPARYQLLDLPTPASAEQKGVTVVSSANLLSQQGIAKVGAQQMQRRLGEAVLAFVSAVNQHLGMELGHNIGMVLVATVLGALRQGKEEFSILLKKTGDQALPPNVIPFVRSYVGKHSELTEVSSCSEWTRNIERALYAGKLQELRQHYAVSGVAQGKQPAITKTSQESNSSCVLM